MVFTDSEITWQRLDYRLLMNSPVALYWKKEIWRNDISWFKDHKYQIVQIDTGLWSSQDDFHSHIKDSLDFPNYYGCNLDAFNDCLGDLQFTGVDGIVIAFENYDKWNSKAKEVSQVILDIIARCSYHHLLFGNRLVALVQSNDAKIEFKPVGQRPAMWNPQEWLNKNRGL